MKEVTVTGFSRIASDRLKAHFNEYVSGGFPVTGFYDECADAIFFNKEDSNISWDSEAFVFEHKPTFSSEIGHQSQQPKVSFYSFLKLHEPLELVNSSGKINVWVFDYAQNRPRIKADMSNEEIRKSYHAKYKK